MGSPSPAETAARGGAPGLRPYAISNSIILIAELLTRRKGAVREFLLAGGDFSAVVVDVVPGGGVFPGELFPHPRIL